MARKFLYFIAILIFLAVAGAIAFSAFPGIFMRTAYVPTADFEEQEVIARSAYADPEMWFVHPDKSDNPASWQPSNYVSDAGPMGLAAIFFVHPTSYLDRSRWNARLDDPLTNTRARLFIRGEASVFNAAGEIWAPRYRQATLGAFLTDDATAQRAFDLAYRDVETAFDHFIATVPADAPIILAGHSQGSLHLTTVLRKRVAGKPLARRIVAAYVVGWPISVETDLAALGLPACRQPDSTRCIISWQSFAEPADTDVVTDAYERTAGFDGKSRKNTRMLCSNPLSGRPDTGAPADANLGTVRPTPDFADGELVTGAVPARCDDDLGFLLIGDPPKLGGYVLPGNNYHVFDYPLFWASTRVDVMRRLAAFRAQ